MSRLGFQTWMAGIREWRIALLTSLLCMAAITVAVLRPDLIPLSGEESATSQGHYQVPPKPAEAGQSAPIVIEPPAPKAVAKPAKTATAVTKKPTGPASPPPVKTIPATKEPQTAGYYIQLGTFRERALAENLATKLRRSHLHVQLIEKNGMHAVWAGPWTTREKADASKQDIYKRTRLKGFVIRK